MKKSKLLRLLQRFSEKELIRLVEMVGSPFFNKNLKCKQLLDIIIEYFEAPESVDISKEVVFKKLFPHKAKFNSSLSVVSSKLTELAEEFLIQDRLKDHDYFKKYLLLESLKEKELWVYFERKYVETKKKHEASKLRGPQFYIEKLLFTKSLREYHLEYEKGDKNFDPRLLIKLLDEIYLGYRLLLSYAANLNAEYDKAQLEIIMKLARTSDLLDTPLIKLFYTAVLMLKESEQTAHFHQFMSLIDKHHRIIPRKELSELFSVAANYCVNKIKKGHSNFRQELFSVYNKTVQYNALIISTYLSHYRMKNIISLAAQLGEFEWGNQFLEEYIDFISPNFRKGVYNFNKAIICFYQKNYDNSLMHLNKMEGKIDTVYELNRKFLSLKTYFELKEDELLINMSLSFKQFLRTNESIAKNEEKAYKNFTNILLKIVKLRAVFDAKLDKKIEQELNDGRPLVTVEWLKTKLDLLRD